jgi:hypothetical protein
MLDRRLPASRHPRPNSASDTEIAAEALADHLAAAIRGSVYGESRYLEIFG